MAEYGLSNFIIGAMNGVMIITSIDFISPTATLRAITSVDADNAVPVTGPTI